MQETGEYDMNDVRVKSFIKKIDQNWESLLKRVNVKKRDEVALTLQRLRENIERSSFRYGEYLLIERNVSSEKSSIPLRTRQLKLVDKTEAFHQQIYSTISVLILVLNHIKIDGVKEDHPINSVKRFLQFLKEKPYRYQSVLHDQVDTLLKSVDFRAKFVDHPQNHPVHDWMTYDYIKDTYLIYFIKRGPEVYYMPGNPDPEAPDFLPPVNCGEDFFVSPNIHKVNSALMNLVDQLLGL